MPPLIRAIRSALGGLLHRHTAWGNRRALRGIYGVTGPLGRPSPQPPCGVLRSMDEAEDTATHGRWMRRSYALCFGAVTLRILLALFLAAGLTFDTAYRIVSWASWLVNLAAVEWWLRRQAVAGSDA